jgi:hypothetical protein
MKISAITESLTSLPSLADARSDNRIPSTCRGNFAALGGSSANHRTLHSRSECCATKRCETHDPARPGFGATTRASHPGAVQLHSDQVAMVAGRASLKRSDFVPDFHVVFELRAFFSRAVRLAQGPLVAINSNGFRLQVRVMKA